MRTTYLFTAAAALLVASIPAFADGDCLTWKIGDHAVQACVAPGTDASGTGYWGCKPEPSEFF